MSNLNDKKVTNKIGKIDYVIHLASTSMLRIVLKIKKMYDNNLGCFKNVLNYCIKNKCKLIHIIKWRHGKQINIEIMIGGTLKPQLYGHKTGRREYIK